MRYCGPRGLAHDVFLGWSRHSRDAALWWVIHEGQTCRSCGTRPEEWDPKQGGDRHAYAARPTHCRGCEVRGSAERALEKERSQYRGGTTIALRKVAPGGDRVDES